MAGRKYHDLAIRAVCVYLKADGKSSSATSAITGIPTKTVTNLYRRACDRGFDLTARPLVMKDEGLQRKPVDGSADSAQVEFSKNEADEEAGAVAGDAEGAA
ncbi:uncharacterized protein B0I36DRAFT_370297 [Microdochium trichocladiopsis]|uniref:Uncharacterized protein n=1 Tax=Microdochium trichocladiopsis TaxID=1682393 RepID=A0A9P8XQ06_9PEZI|nr:uncharacterized protein B0I36DRAFT_370297 [Microdochium trichocladiopsis]KAH7010704.1 hypothetical protein B0I36DRAFT_370297 [Microdochium trichocladiopsis]